MRQSAKAVPATAAIMEATSCQVLIIINVIDLFIIIRGILSSCKRTASTLFIPTSEDKFTTKSNKRIQEHVNNRILKIIIGFKNFYKELAKNKINELFKKS